jgi:hypothetical protein
MSQLRESKIWTLQLYERKSREAMCQEPSLTMVSFLLLVLDYGYSKIIVFSALGAEKTTI